MEPSKDDFLLSPSGESDSGEGALDKILKPCVYFFLVAIALFGIALIGIWLYSVVRGSLKRQAEVEEARGQVIIWADRLDGHTTPAGVYIKVEGKNDGDLPESDPWDNPLRYQYSRGGIMEIVKVRSVGPDGKPATRDDLVEVRKSVNLAGIGSGVRDNIEGTIEGGARGFFRGGMQGLKEELTPEWLDKFKKREGQ